MENFYNYTEEDARKLLVIHADGSNAYRALKFYSGDHLHSRDEWRGPRPNTGDGQADELVWQDIERSFISYNLVKEVADRHTFGVLGREPMWSFDLKRQRRRKSAADSEGSPLVDQLDDLIIPWWDKRKILILFRRAVINLLLTGRGHLRLYVPPQSLSQRLRNRQREVYITIPEPGKATVYCDPVTMQEIAIYSYKRGEENVTEVSFLNDDGMTVIRTLRGESKESLLDKARTGFAAMLNAIGIRSNDIVDTVTLDLRGHLHIYEMRREPLINTQFLQLQCLMNMALSMLPRNVILGGFLERIYINIQKPRVKQLKAGSTTEYEEVETTSVQAGPASSTFATGMPRYNEEGMLVGYESGDVRFREPIPVKTFEDTIRIGYEKGLHQGHQAHIIDPGSGEFGAEARKQARDDYEKSLLMTKVECDAAGRWILEAAGTLLANFSGVSLLSTILDNHRASFDSRIDIGPLNSEERRMMQEEVGKELMSRFSYMNRIGVDDPNAEVELINNDTSLSALKLRLELAKLAREMGLEDKFRELVGLPAGAPLPEPPQPDQPANGDSQLIQ